MQHELHNGKKYWHATRLTHTFRCTCCCCLLPGDQFEDWLSLHTHQVPARRVAPFINQTRIYEAVACARSCNQHSATSNCTKKTKGAVPTMYTHAVTQAYMSLALATLTW